ncbi:MAG TPA: MFS transporter [Gemmataceae bacterium]|nr:MFS transporter [Gemmataceae bacterium]
MTTFQPADNLRSRTFLGLLVAQFLAAFNDQAIHASSMFFAINTNAMSKDTAISLMPILFYAPWALFCTLAGYLADRYSKWNSLVFWKVAEIAITAIALVGFWLGTHGVAFGPYLVLSTVFLMGTHSAFFVPAKYGAMPEILQPHMLSRGNGLLESLSFLAVILGTVLGGVLSQVFRGEEHYIGLILVGLAAIGALASLMMRRMPAANPHRPFPPYLYQPLWQSIRTLLRSRPLALAVVGIAFFTFIVAFMRSTMYMHGQTRVPPWDEALTSEVVGMVALGIGLGSPLVGFLSGGKVELGMVPIGALGMIAATLIAACALDHLPALVVCITLIGFFTGFYIVPLFTLLQHRAPKTSKGDAIATSNLINVTGAIVASVLFFLSVGAAHLSGITPRVATAKDIEGQLVEDPQYEDGKPVRIVIDSGSPKPLILARTHGKRSRAIDVETELIDVFSGGLKAGDRVIDRKYQLGTVTYHRIRRADQGPKPFYDESGLPRLLFVGAASLTLLTLMLLRRQMPDLFLRTLIWLRTQPRYRLEIEGLNHLPDKGPVVVATNARDLEACLHIVSATDRATRFLLVDDGQSAPLPAWLRLAAKGASLGRWLPGVNGKDEQLLRRTIEHELSRGGVVALACGSGRITERLLGELAVPLLPVWYEPAPQPERKRRRRIYILAGRLLPAGSTIAEVEREWQRLAEEVQQRAARGGPLKHLEFAEH